MPVHNPNARKLITRYFQRARPFARPICQKIRGIIHKADRRIIEDWKWGPNFYKDGMVCGLAHFKEHVHLFFFRGTAMKDPKRLFVHGETNRHIRGIKFTDARQVNETALLAYVREAVKLNERGVKAEEKKIALPSDFRTALRKNRKALEFFQSSSYTNRKEYVQWITGAKMKETRVRRLKTAVSKLSRKIKFS